MSIVSLAMTGGNMRIGTDVKLECVVLTKFLRHGGDLEPNFGSWKYGEFLFLIV